VHDDEICGLLEDLEDESDSGEEDCFFELRYLNGVLKPVSLLQTNGVGLLVLHTTASMSGKRLKFYSTLSNSTNERRGDIVNNARNFYTGKIFV
jgi:hypothetical protein